MSSKRKSQPTKLPKEEGVEDGLSAAEEEKISSSENCLNSDDVVPSMDVNEESNMTRDSEVDDEDMLEYEDPDEMEDEIDEDAEGALRINEEAGDPHKDLIAYEVRRKRKRDQ